MEKLFLYGFNAQKIPGYDCSAANKTLDEWYAEGTVSLPTAVYCLSYGSVILVVYFVVLMSLWRLKNKLPVYLIMFNLGIYDVVDILTNCICTGYFYIMGASFCTHPNLNYVAGAFGLGIWCSECMCCLLLGFSRVLDFLNSSWHDSVFGGKKLFFWLCLPVLWGGYLLVFTPPVLFHSSLHAWFFSPMILKTKEEQLMFTNFPHTVNNLGVVVATCCIYFLLVFIIGHKYGFSQLQKVSHLQRNIVAQCVLICMVNLVASIIYVYFNFFAAPGWLVYTAQVLWQFATGIPAMTYIAMNQSVRRDMLRFIGIKPTTVSSVQISNQPATNPTI